MCFRRNKKWEDREVLLLKIKMGEEIITKKGDIQRIPPYINGLADKLEGGIPKGHITLIAGAAGTMKSSLTFNIMYNEALNGRVSLYLSLEQTYTSLINHMINMDFDMSKVNVIVISDVSKLDEQIDVVKDQKKGALIITDLSALRKQVVGSDMTPTGDWLNVIKNIVRKIKVQVKLDLFVLDSLSALYALSNFKDPRVKLFHIFEFLRDNNLTSFLISEMDIDSSKYSEFGVEDYLADGIISLRLTHRDGKEVTELTIVKMRTTKCNRDVYVLRKDEKGFHALSKLG
jgi:circadian clock protein KaiC